jgi:hypothetical protein
MGRDRPLKLLPSLPEEVRSLLESWDAEKDDLLNPSCPLVRKAVAFLSTLPKTEITPDDWGLSVGKAAAVYILDHYVLLSTKAAGTLGSVEQLGALDAVETQVSAHQEAVAYRIQVILDAHANAPFRSLEAKRQFAVRIQRLLNLCESRIECPKCGEPAALRCSVVGNAKQGAFLFEHTTPKRALHGGTANLPAGLKIVPLKKEQDTPK